MVEMNDLHMEKREIVQQIMDRLGTEVIKELPLKVEQVISHYVDIEFTKQEQFRNDYAEFFDEELGQNRYSYVQSVQRMRDMVWDFKS